MLRVSTSINSQTLTFSVKWWVVLLYLMFFMVLLALGFWQLERAAEKQQIIATFEQRIQLPPQPIATMIDKPAQHQYQRITTKGRYDTRYQFLLDNQFHQHRLGFHVLSAFKPDTGVRWLLVDRGWVPAGRTRQQLPKLTSVIGQRALHGRLYIPSSKHFVLNDKQDNPGDWPRIIQKVDFAKQSQMLGHPLLPFVLRLSPSAPDGYVRDWPLINSPPSKHKGYALQWFAFAIVLIILFVAVHLKREEQE
jgi:surfeit locus 1 family protein